MKIDERAGLAVIDYWLVWVPDLLQFFIDLFLRSGTQTNYWSDFDHY